MIQKTEAHQTRLYHSPYLSISSQVKALNENTVSHQGSSTKLQEIKQLIQSVTMLRHLMQLKITELDRAIVKTLINLTHPHRKEEIETLKDLMKEREAYQKGQQELATNAEELSRRFKQ